MRRYIAKIKITDELLKESTGQIGEIIFEQWFTNNFQGERLYKQKADRDYQGVDFADEKGFRYQVKTTKEKTYTFNCDLEDINEHLTSDIYVFIQIKNKIAYIETFHDKNYIRSRIKASFRYKNTFVWAEELQQSVLNL
jgi:hypothetical protein